MKRKVKQWINLVLVLLFSMSNFAAIVSDNDGSAFITKAEVDSLKNDFQYELERYYTTIDSKISDAIAAYLAAASAGKTTSYTQDLGVFSTPLDIYMNFKDRSDNARNNHRSDWRPTQKWRLMFGYANAYATNWINVYTNTYNPKQWYNLERNADDTGWQCSGGYKEIATTCSYLIWGATDTSISQGSTSDSNYGYIVAGNGSSLGSGEPRTKQSEANHVYDVLRIGEWSWESNKVEAPTLYGVTGVNNMSSSGTNMSIKKHSSSTSASPKGILTNSDWYIGWSGIVASSQQTNKKTNKVNAIPSKGDDWVHVLYNDAIKYSVSDEYIGKGAIDTESAETYGMVNQLRTFERDVSESDTGPYAFCLAPFSIIEEGYKNNSFTTAIDFTDWKNTSLVKAKHIIQTYKEAGPNKTDLQVGISDGLYLMTSKDEGSAELTIKLSYTGEVPFIVAKTEPILESNVADIDMAANGFKKISGGSKTYTTTNSYLKYLDNGITNIKIENIGKDVPIFIKILRSSSSEGCVTLQDPIAIDYTKK